MLKVTRDPIGPIAFTLFGVALFVLMVIGLRMIQAGTPAALDCYHIVGGETALEACQGLSK